MYCNVNYYRKYVVIMQRGYSLLELIFGMSIGLILVGICINHLLQVMLVFGNFWRGVVTDNAVAVVRFYVSTDLLNGGFRTRIEDNDVINWCMASLEDCGGIVPNVVLGMVMQNEIKSGSGILVISNVVMEVRFLVSDLQTFTEVLQVHENMLLHNGDFCFISDYEHTDSFVVSDYSAKKIWHKNGHYLGDGLKKLYQVGAIIFCPRTVVYYIKKNLSTGNYALYRDDIVRNAISLIDNIIDLQIIENDHEILLQLHFTENLIKEIAFATP